MFLGTVKKLFIALVCTQLVFSTAWAQEEDAEASTSTRGPRKQLATIVFAGLAGATLGLSTLSFYGRPQEKLKNVPIGLALGVIVGAVYTTYRVSTRPYQYEEVDNFQLEREEQLKSDIRFESASPSSQLLAWSWGF